MIKLFKRDTITRKKEKSFSSIGLRSFLTVILILSTVIAISGILSYIIPQGEFQRDNSGAIIPGTYSQKGIGGIAVWRILTAPLRVFVSEDSLTIIMISLFLLIMSGIFNLIDKTGGIKILIGRIMKKLRDKGGPIVCLTTLIFMLFGSFFGMFEELVTLLPLVIMFMLSINMDTMTGLGACLLAACFGFSAAITNPFSVGLAAQVADIAPSTGVWLRIVFFALVYAVLCVFLMMHLRKIEKDPKLSPTYESDIQKRQSLLSDNASCIKDSDKIFKVYTAFFAVQGILLILIASVKAISDLAIPLLAASFLMVGITAGLFVSEKKRDVFVHFFNGALSMLPAVLMIALASSVKLIMTESGILDTIMNGIITYLNGKSKFFAIVLIYLLILIIQVFIGSASAKIMLIMPIIMPTAVALGLSPAIVILAYCMADGFTDVILPTNPVLLVGLSMANVSYGKWARWTWKLQVVIFVLTVLVLFFGIAINY
ncbi:MAG: YfcC family protein [Ruminococcaceae bacterium]|nr:YfcC family protein [Oscillospiraceae bacterium]